MVMAEAHYHFVTISKNGMQTPSCIAVSTAVAADASFMIHSDFFIIFVKLQQQQQFKIIKHFPASC